MRRRQRPHDSQANEGVMLDKATTMVKMVTWCVLVTAIWTTPSFAQTASLASVRVYKFGGRNSKALNEDNIPDGLGSGWLISDTQVVTAYHVVHRCRQGDKQLQVRFPDGWRSWAVIEATDLKNDLALLWINSHPWIKAIPCGEVPEEGEDVKIHGFGYDYEYRTHVGEIQTRLKNAILDDFTGQNWRQYLYAFYGLKKGKSKPGQNGPWQAVHTVALPGHSGGVVTHKGLAIGSVLSITDKYSIICRIDTIRGSFKDKLK